MSTLAPTLEISSNITDNQLCFTTNDSIGDLSEIKPFVIHYEYNLSDNPVDILSFDNIFLETDSAQEMIFKRDGSGLIHNLPTDVDPGYIIFENFWGYKMVSDGVKGFHIEYQF